MFDLHKRCRAEREAQIATLADEVKYLRGQVRLLSERNDRLTESLTRREGGQLNLPIEPYQVPPAPDASPLPADPSSAEALAARSRSIDGWWRAMTSPGHTIATPVKEEKVPAPS